MLPKQLPARSRYWWSYVDARALSGTICRKNDRVTHSRESAGNAASAGGQTIPPFRTGRRFPRPWSSAKGWRVEVRLRHRASCPASELSKGHDDLSRPLPKSRDGGPDADRSKRRRSPFRFHFRLPLPLPKNRCAGVTQKRRPGRCRCRFRRFGRRSAVTVSRERKPEAEAEAEAERRAGKWRERVGIEPTDPGSSRTTTVLKTAPPTRTAPPPSDCVKP
jgi:hypothetical protein